jgi:hypothetical protein
MATDFVLKSAQAFDPERLPRVTVELSDGSRYDAHGFDPSALQLQVGYIEEVAETQDGAAVLAELRGALLHAFDETDANGIMIKARSAQNPVSVTELFNDTLPKLIKHYEPQVAAYQQEMGLTGANREQRRVATKKKTGKKTTPPQGTALAAGQ